MKPSSSCRVLHCISGLFFGGGQRMALDLVASQPEGGKFTAALCTLGLHAGSPLIERSSAILPYDGRYNAPFTVLRAAWRLRRELTRQGAVLLHTHGIDADLIGGFAVAGTKIRHVCHLHISPGSNKTESWKATARRQLFRQLTWFNGAWFIAVSESVRVQMIPYYGLPAARVITVLNGIHPIRFPTPPHHDSPPLSRAIFGSAGRLAPMKGFDYLIKAVARLKSLGVDCELRIAGTGNSMTELVALSSQCGVDDRVRFVGHISDMSFFYSHIDAFVLPSISTEGLPLVLLEAMAAGVPVVATRLAGTPEVISDGQHGFLVPPADVNALSEAMLRLAKDKPLRHEVAAAGRQRVLSDFNFERVTLETQKVYERALKD